MKQAFTNTSSSRSVSMRDIKLFSSGLYPALQACGVTRPTGHCTLGFTLIELLVVVLIIGILAAVALPQYQTAVERSRATEAFILLKSIKEARDVYKLSNPDVSSPLLSELDIEIPGTDTAPIVGSASNVFHQTKYFQVGMLGSGHPHAFRVSDGNLLYTLAYYDSANGWFCHVENGGDVKYTSVCKSLGGTPSDACNGNNDGKCFRLP